jgi:alcohol dehydrogenase (cytochrome c)
VEKLHWSISFIEYGTVFNVGLPDTHDWDVGWGTSITKLTFDNGTQRR